MRIVMGLLWVVSGVILFVYSGRAEGLVSARTIPAIILLFLVVIDICAIIFYVLRALYKRHIQLSKTQFYVVLSRLFAVILVMFSMKIDRRAVEETMQRGDALIAAIEQYKTAHGIYPESIDSMEFAGFKPALRGSSFTYHKKGDESFLVLFESVTFMMCSKENAEANWYCDD